MLVSEMTRRVFQPFSSSPLSLSTYRHLQTTLSPCLKLSLHQYEHIGTGARIYHFSNTDPERAFATIVKTFPQNNKGCPHILQHLACCGSQKYPVRDPFFNMLKRSVNSYMNAWTGDDFTAYPFASANSKDWSNLYGVYLDMTFRPLLKRLDFLQEGWREEVDQQGKRQIKGIVFNQMKGAYQDSDRQMMTAISSSLMRGTPYEFDSGGHPREIVRLEYQELTAMHRYYYHPSNMSFFYYGSGSFEQELRMLDEQYLQGHSMLEHSPKTPLVPNPSSHYRDIISFTSECNSCSLSFYLGPTDQIPEVDLMALNFLSYLLFEKANSLAYIHLIESGVAKSMGFAGLSSGMFTTFTLSLKGIYPNYEAQQLQRDLKDILLKVQAEGVDPKKVEQFAYQTEVKLKTPEKINGIQLLEKTLHLMNHRFSFRGFLNPSQLINEATQKIQEPLFLEALLNRYFFKNQHFVSIRQLMSENSQGEEQINVPLQKEQKDIRADQEELERWQGKGQSLEVLPKLGLKDLVRPERRQASLVQREEKNSKCFEHYHMKIEEDINVYRLIFRFDSVDDAFVRKLHLWIYSVNSTISTSQHSYRQMAHQIAINNAEFSVFTAVGSGDYLNLIFEFTCLPQKVNSAFSNLEQVLFSSIFERERSLNIFKNFQTETVESLLQNPMDYCLNEAASPLQFSASSINSYQQVKDSLNLIKNGSFAELANIGEELRRCPKVILVEHSNKPPIQQPSSISNLLDIKGSQMTQRFWKKSFPSKAVTHAYGVNFCSQQYPGPTFLSRQHAHLNIFLELLQQDYLHIKIRQHNGAYGTGAKVSEAGTISLFSYFDPNSSLTFKIFDDSIEELLSKDVIQTRKLQEAKLIKIGLLDLVKPPQDQGMGEILKKYSKIQYQSFREHIKNASFQEVVETSRRMILRSERSRCFFGRQTSEGFFEEKLKRFLL